jgi:membrane protein
MERADSPALASIQVARLPARLRPLAERVLQHWLGRFVLGCMVTSRRIELFDRSMTLAAQIFTSVLPILIALASWFGRDSSDLFGNAVALPPETQGLVDDVLAAPSDSTLGLLGVLVVLVSATSLSRAMTRACAALWDLPRPTSRLSSAWRWVAVVLALAVSLVAARQIHDFSARLPPPGFWDTVAAAASDVAIALFIPTVLLAGALPLRRMVPWALLFAAVMLVVRPAAAVYLPHALQTSAERYGPIGVAFTYLTWLYVLAFCFLFAGVMGKVIATDEGRVGTWIRGSTQGSPASGESQAHGDETRRSFSRVRRTRPR